MPDYSMLLWSQETPTRQFGKLPLKIRVAWYQFSNEIWELLPESGLDLDVAREDHNPLHQDMKQLVDYTHIPGIF